MKVTNLKLLATSNEDLKVIAAHLQDAIISTSSHMNLFNCIKKILFFLKFAILVVLAIESCKWAEIILKSSSVLAINFKFLASTLNSFYSSFTIFQFFF